MAKNFLSISFFIIVILLSFAAILFLCRYDVLIRDDLVFSFGRDFLEPEHGRYIANYFTNLFAEVLPEIFNIHPNDFKPVYVSFIKAFGVIIICYILANAGFIFSKTNRKIWSFPLVCVYTIVFLSLFNEGYFFSGLGQFILYFNIFESIVFFEYYMSLVPLFILLSFITYFIVKKQYPSKNSYVFLLISAFFTGISVDPINVPILFILGTFSFGYLIFSKIKIDKKTLFLSFGFYFAYLLGFFLYFRRPVHHFPDYDNLGITDYFVKYFPTFWEQYVYDFIMQQSKILLPIVLIIVFLCIFRKNYCISNKRICWWIITNVICFLIFYLFLFFLGFYDSVNKTFYINFYKWVNLYKVICLFLFVLIIGYAIDENSHVNYVNAPKIKIIICLLILIIFNNGLVVEYIPNLIKNSEERKNIREAAYVVEKAAVSQSGDKILIPDKYERYNGLLYYDQEGCSIFAFIKLIHPESDRKYDVEYYSNDISYNNDFLPDEIEKLKFQNTIHNRLYRYKKIIKDCY